MSKMEKDLGTLLEWVAIPHFNTEHQYIYVAMREIKS
jgi:type IV secretory pathway VirD2 relaxase